MADSTKAAASGKSNSANKSRKDFPLYIHKASGRWSKKVRGGTVYFTKVIDDPKGDAALDKWLKDKDDLLAGRTPARRSAKV